MAIIEVENATKIYKIGEVETLAINDVTASFEPGEFAALVGPSGSGKTTMLQVMGCLDKPTSGVVKIAMSPVVILAPAENGLARCLRILVGTTPWRRSSASVSRRSAPTSGMPPT